MPTPREARPEDATRMARNLAILAREILAMAKGNTPSIEDLEAVADDAFNLAKALDGGWLESDYAPRPD